MDCCLSVIARHRSIRAFKQEPVKEEHLKAILEAARRHPSAWNLQPVHVAVVRDPELKSRLADILWGQEHIRQAPVFLVFSVDYAKLWRALEQAGVERRPLGVAELLQGVLAAGMAAAWAALAAESLGYGVSFIAVYGKPCEVAEAIGAPEGVLPVVGLNVGVPAEDPEVRPRMPLAALASENGYGSLDEAAKAYAETAEGFLDKVARVMRRGGPVDGMNSYLYRCLEERGYKLAP